MKKSLLNTLKINRIKESIIRFPLCYFYIAVFVVLLFLVVNDFYIVNRYHEYIVRFICTLVPTFFLSLGIYLSLENIKKLKPIYNSLSQLIPIVFAVLFYISFDANEVGQTDTMLFFLSLTGILVLLFFSPFIKNIKSNGTPNNLFYVFIYKLALVFIFGFIFGGILMLLGFLAILAINLLFEPEGSFVSDLYGNWAIFALALVTPIKSLLDIPDNNDVLDKKFEIGEFISGIIRYVFISALGVYFIILYAYSIKVLFNFDSWPQSQVSELVIAFSSFGYICYILTYYFAQTNKFISAFRKFIPFLVIPQLFMLFYAIYLRIAQYDFTMNRYLVVAFGIWLLVVSIYYIFSRLKNLMFVPASLVLFIFFIQIGPWSVYNFPEIRQINRLETNMIKAHMLIGNGVYPLENYTDIDAELSGEIYEGIYYLCYVEDCNYVMDRFANFYMGENKWDIVRNIASELNIKEYEDLMEAEFEQPY